MQKKKGRKVREEGLPQGGAGGDAVDWHLSMSLATFHLCLGVAWQLPGCAHVRFAVGETLSRVAQDAHYDRLHEHVVPAGRFARVRDQYLVVQAGGWEYHPGVRFHAPCVNEPGPRVRLSDLTGYWREVVQGVIATRALAGVSEREGPPAFGPVQLRFEGSRMLIGFFGETRALEGEE